MALLSRTRSLAALAVAAGLMAAAPAPGATATALSIDYFWCTGQEGTLWCEAEVSGATGPVTYTWSPQGMGQETAFVLCKFGLWYQWQQVTLTVTDGSTTATARNMFYCHQDQ